MALPPRSDRRPLLLLGWPLRERQCPQHLFAGDAPPARRLELVPTAPPIRLSRRPDSMLWSECDGLMDDRLYGFCQVCELCTDVSISERRAMKRETLPVFRARRETIAYEDRLTHLSNDVYSSPDHPRDVTVTSRHVTVTSRRPETADYEEYSLDLDDEPTQVHRDCIPVRCVRANDITLVVSFDLGGTAGERILVFQGSKEETALIQCFLGDVELALARGSERLSSSRQSGR